MNMASPTEKNRYRSRTQGRGMFTMQFDHYEEVPKSVAEKIIGNRAKESK